jgi:hypothetical protein
MPNVYVEARPKGRPEGIPIEDFVVEDHADHALGTFKTQKEKKTGGLRTSLCFSEPDGCYGVGLSTAGRTLAPQPRNGHPSIAPPRIAGLML